MSLKSFGLADNLSWGQCGLWNFTRIVLVPHVDPHALCRVSEDMILAGTVMCTFFRQLCTENVAGTGTPVMYVLLATP